MSEQEMGHGREGERERDVNVSSGFEIISP
jgi:hypothetical protein